MLSSMLILTKNPNPGNVFVFCCCFFFGRGGVRGMLLFSFFVRRETGWGGAGEGKGRCWQRKRNIVFI